VLQTPTAGGHGTTTVVGTLNSTPGRVFLIQFFASSGTEEGEVFLGSRIVITNANGNSPAFSFGYVPVAGKPFITATATDLQTGDTSEFSAAVSAASGPAAPAAFATSNGLSLKDLETGTNPIPLPSPVGFATPGLTLGSGGMLDAGFFNGGTATTFVGQGSKISTVWVLPSNAPAADSAGSEVADLWADNYGSPGAGLPAGPRRGHV
jgi:hypothetical protein